MKKINYTLVFLVSVFYLFSCSTREFRKSSAKDSFISSDPVVQGKLNQAKPLINSGNREFQAGNFEKAAELGDEANHNYPTAEGYYLIGASNFKLDHHDKAITALEDGLRIAPENEQIGLTYAMVLTSRGENEKALDVYDGLIRRYPQEKLYLFKKGVIQKTLKNYKDAWSTLKKADEGEPPAFAAQLYMQLGDVALQLKKFDEAETYFAKAKKINPELEDAGKSQSATSVAKLLEEGNNAVKEKKYKEAIYSFKKAVGLSESPATPLVFLGNAYMLDGNSREAEASFRKAIELNPNFIEGYSALGTLFYRNGDYSKSKSILGSALELFPKDPILHNKMGLALKGLGDDKFAVVHFSKALDIKPDYNEARVNLVYQLIELGRFREARKEKDLLKEDQSEIGKLIDVKEEIATGDLDLREGKVDKSLVHYQKAMGINRKEPSVYNAFGRAYFIKKDLKNSEKNYKEALELDQENIPAIQGLIRLYNKFNKKMYEARYKMMLKKVAANDPLNAIMTGREFEDDEKYDKALAEYKKVLADNPGNESARFRTGMVYYKMALQANSNDQFDTALKLLEESRKFNSDIPEVASTEKNIRDNKKFEKIIPLVRKANSYYDSGKYDKAIELYRSAYDKSHKISLLVKIAESYLSMGEEEKGIKLLKNAAEEKGSEYEVKEAINAYLLRKGEVKKAEAGFQEILEKRPDSYYSNYQLGLIQLTKKKYDDAISYFDKSLIFNSSYIPAIAGRGIAFYKLGKKSLALAEFKEAAKKDDTLEVAPFNIGMVFYNDKMFVQARSVFEDLIKRYPDFPDAYYHLSYVNFYYSDLTKAELNIKKALEIARKPEYIYAYIKILETSTARHPNPASQVTMMNLSKELAERFPGSDYAKKAKKKLIAASPDMVISQPYNLKNSLASTPFIINGKIILNYGTSVVLMDKIEKTVTWKIEPDQQFTDISAYSRLYGINGNSVNELDMYNGEIIKSQQLPFKPVTIYTYTDAVIVSGNTARSVNLAVYDSNLKLLQNKTFDKKTVISADDSGNIYQIHVTGKGIEVKISDSTFSKFENTIIKKANGTVRPAARLEKSVLIYNDGDYYEILAKGSANKIKFELKAATVWSTGDTVFFSTSKGVYKLASGSKKPELVADADYAILKDDRVLVIDRKGNTELKKKSGDRIWKGVLDQYKNIGRQEIYSVIFN